MHCCEGEKNNKLNEFPLDAKEANLTAEFRNTYFAWRRSEGGGEPFSLPDVSNHQQTSEHSR